MSCLPQPRLLLPPAIIVHTSRFQIDQRNVFYLHILPYLGLVSSNAPMQCSRCKSRARVCKSTEARYFIWASGHAPRATGGCGSSSWLHMLHKVLFVGVYIWICVLDYLNKTQVSRPFGAKPPCQDLMKNANCKHNINI